MPLQKLFKSIDLVNLHDGESYHEHLDLVTCTYVFSVVWTNGPGCSLNFLSGNRPPSTIWHPLVPPVQTDNDGEISLELGKFPSGTQLQLSWGIQAVDAIPRLAILIVNTTTKTVLKIPPNDQYKQLARGEFWQASQTFNTPN